MYTLVVFFEFLTHWYCRHTNFHKRTTSTLTWYAQWKRSLRGLSEWGWCNCKPWLVSASLAAYGPLLCFIFFITGDIWSANLLLLCSGVLWGFVVAFMLFNVDGNFNPFSFYWDILASSLSRIIYGDFILGSNLYFWIAILPVTVSCSLLLEHPTT